MPLLQFMVAYWWVLPLIALIAAYRLILRVVGVVVIPNDQIGVVNKKFVLFGRNRTLPDGRIVALNGEAGIQADTLAPGLHFWLWPWQYEIDKAGFVTVPQGKVGLVESRDGKPLGHGHVLAKTIECGCFQDARAFLANGGERGPQMAIIPPGTYRVNLKLFSISSADVLEIEDNAIGVVTTQEGQPLLTGDIAGKEVPGHNMFQDGQSFVENGGYKGLQEQVLLAGRYFINPRFATVELKPLTEVPIAYAGVVIAYVGEAGKDVSGETFKHGNLVSRGQRGVWAEPLDPGKYPMNPYTHKVEAVPTANVVLNWATGKTEAHQLDKNLSTITVRSSDGFKFNLDVSQIIHIPRNDAPKVIARFGNVANLVTQVLEPTIGNYFRNAAQGSDVIDFLKKRQERQAEAKKAIQEALNEYNVGAVDTLIGDIVPPDELMKTLTDRKIAEQEKVTYETQRLAEVQRKELEQARAQAATQAKVVDSERSVAIAEFAASAAVKKAEGDATASIKKAEGDAQSKRLNAEADAAVLKLTGDAEAVKIAAVGRSEADVIRQKTEAVGQGNYALIEVARAFATSGTQLVPQIVASGSDGGGSTNLVNLLLTNLLRQEEKIDLQAKPLHPVDRTA